MTDDLIDDLQPTIQLLHQLARALDDFEDVDAFLLSLDFVGELAPAPVLGFRQ